MTTIQAPKPDGCASSSDGRLDREMRTDEERWETFKRENNKLKNENYHLRNDKYRLENENQKLRKENQLLKNETRELKKMVLELHEDNEKLRFRKHPLAAIVKENKTLKAQIACYRAMLFGPKTERSESEVAGTDKGISDESPPPEVERRPRGQKRGSAGHGRRIYSSIPTEYVVHELHKEELLCPRCRKPYRELPKADTSQELDFEVTVRRIVHQRKRYGKSCRCPDVPAFITAPGPAKLIPSGILSVGMVSHILVEKFGMGRPVSKILELMRFSSGLDMSEGTVVGVMQKLDGMLRSLYLEIIKQSRRARHLHADETGWKVYEHIKDKKGYNWWLWVFSSVDAVAFIIDPSRSRKVIKKHIGKGTGPPQRILSSDMFRIYDYLDDIISSYCWAHMRRHFIKAMQGYRKALDAWGQEWLKRIRTLYDLNHRRLETDTDSPEWEQAETRLRQHLEETKQVRDEQINDPELHEKGKEVLYTLVRYWEGLIVFLDHPEVPLDNNEAERCLRGPVVGRKNYYGSGSDWSGQLAAMVFSILATAEKNNLNPLTYMKSYLQACAQAGGKAPESLDSFLPWKMSDQDREVLSAPTVHAA